MAFDVVGDLLARDRRSSAPALRDATTDRQYDYRRFCTTAWKTGNLLRHYGVRRGDTVGIVPNPTPQSVFAFFGTALLGATAAFEIDSTQQVVVGPTEALPAVSPGTRPIGYGAAPSDSSTAHFEGEVWSENPTMPPDSVSPETPLLVTETDQYSHRALLTAAKRMRDDQAIDADETVSFRATISRPEAIGGGLLAPLLAGAAIELQPAVPDGTLQITTATESMTRIVPIDTIQL